MLQYNSISDITSVTFSGVDLISNHPLIISTNLEVLGILDKVNNICLNFYLLLLFICFKKSTKKKAPKKKAPNKLKSVK